MELCLYDSIICNELGAVEVVPFELIVMKEGEASLRPAEEAIIWDVAPPPCKLLQSYEKTLDLH